ncbi:hypothetical protein Alches_13020 [Alicyclobacillus hesperidum subsp. aegles]|uniref:chemotaxis protein CheB n=1 Tax=Alicyclobacillus hesperidum TaxID=89784 RepID=UPI0007191D5C|nr:chemotaxis protein CheB [Alicyclobacillus hesperidum]KRW91053.1 histidine kinase [Alicyclobacillus tengchongensis]GLG01263.1 hypothetical protein Alches_13020 [Alicyclobacillus hesperidum subsp. aegles]
MTSSELRPSYIVGIGASAGGLEALTALFEHLAPDTGMAFVVIQHLSPNYRSFMAELLGTHTSMRIVQAEHDMPIEPNVVYLNPPRKNLFIENGRLVVHDHTAIKGELHLPIDGCFHSLGQDIRERAVGVVLSGTGSDGSRGIVTIKRNGGKVFVQDESAKFDGMPRSALASGVVDAVLPPDQLAAQLNSLARGELMVGTTRSHEHVSGEDHDDEMDSQKYQRLLDLLFQNTGIDYQVYKRDGVIRRLKRRMGIENIPDVEQYLELLQTHPESVQDLHKDLLIGVTSFFRDPKAFQIIYEQVLPQIFANRAREREVRVWVAGCSTGEEAYSIAILMQEYMAATGTKYNVKIFATDLDRDAIAFAGDGVYPVEIEKVVNRTRLQAFFTRVDAGYQVKPEIRKMIIFAPHNITKDPPFINTDLITCRNMLIYLQSDVQHRILSLFHFALHSHGFLFLGPSESIGRLANLFVPVNTKWNIFQHADASGALALYQQAPSLPTGIKVASAHVDLAPRAEAVKQQTRVGGSSHTDELYRIFVEEHMPACVVIDDKQDVVSLHGNVNKYLALASGRPSNNVHKMFDSSISVAIVTAISKIRKGSLEVVYDDVHMKDGNDVRVTLVVRPLSHNVDRFRNHVLVLFKEVERRPQSVSTYGDMVTSVNQHVIELERELQMYQEKLQVTVEELETSNEELQATNEEIVAANEELQSTNEELHSVNEELLTINAEYQLNIQQLTELNNDMDNFLASTQIGTLFLDREMKVRRFTPAITKEINLLEVDIGRPISHISHHLKYDEMIQDAEKVLATSIPIEREIESKTGHWYSVRILPYRTAEQPIKGTVLTFVDITSMKKMNEELRKLSYAIEQSPSIVVITDPSGAIEYVNPKFCECTGFTHDEMVGKDIASLHVWGSGETSYASVWNSVVGGSRWAGELPTLRKDGTTYWESLSLVPILSDQGDTIHYLKVAEDITEIKETEELLRKSEMLSAVGELAAGIAHEIRNPLTALKGFTKLIRTGSHSESYLEIMHQELERIESIINELLVLSKPQALHFKPANLVDVIRDVVMLLETQALLNQVEIVFETATEELTIECVENQLKQVFINLVKNAIEAMPNGGVVSVNLALTADEDVLLTVQDQGVGIPEEKLARLGEPFYTTKDKGTGLGLMVSFKIVEQHGGTIRYRSAPGQGTTAEIRLPLHKSPTADAR